MEDDENNEGVEIEEKEEVIEEADNGNMLAPRRALHIQNSPYEDQRLNIFQTKCTINGKVCSIIMDSRS